MHREEMATVDVVSPYVAENPARCRFDRIGT